jgi:large subunit ribosomal protein L24
MKSDTERKMFYQAKRHKRTKRLHVHVSKELKAKLKRKVRALLVRKGDKVKIMRGPGKGNTGKVVKVNHSKMKVFVEGVVIRTARGREMLVALQPSNLLLNELFKTKERELLSTEAAFTKAPEKPKPALKIEKADTVEAEVVDEKKAERPKEASPSAKAHLDDKAHEAKSSGVVSNKNI